MILNQIAYISQTENENTIQIEKPFSVSGLQGGERYLTFILSEE